MDTAKRAGITQHAAVSLHLLRPSAKGKDQMQWCFCMHPDQSRCPFPTQTALASSRPLDHLYNTSSEHTRQGGPISTPLSRKAVTPGHLFWRPGAPLPSPRPHLAVVVQLGQRDVHALVLLLQRVEPGLPAVQLQLRAVQRGLQLLGVGVQFLVLPLQLVVQEIDPGGGGAQRATGLSAEEHSQALSQLCNLRPKRNLSGPQNEGVEQNQWFSSWVLWGPVKVPLVPPLCLGQTAQAGSGTHSDRASVLISSVVKALACVPPWKKGFCCSKIFLNTEPQDALKLFVSAQLLFPVPSSFSNFNSRDK